MQKFIGQVAAAVLALGVVSGCQTGGDVKQVSSPSDRANPLLGMKLYVDPKGSAFVAAKALEAKDPQRALLLTKLAKQPAAKWFGEWSGPIEQAARDEVKAAEANGSNLFAVLYNVPYRDCGQHSAGGIAAKAYGQWVKDFAKGLGEHKAIVVLEPDAIPLIDCLQADTKSERWSLLKNAVETLKKESKAVVYVDVGHSNWIAADEMVRRLKEIGIARADGFAINTSNYQKTEDCVAYGKKLLQEFPGKGLVIDTSRNGKGPAPDAAWCNPRGRGLGALPKVLDSAAPVDAYLWIKRPGESDGTCNGGPRAGDFWSDIALELVQNANSTL